MQMVVVCHEMHWDFYQFKANPPWFVALLAGKLEVDGQNQEKEMKEAERNAKRKSGSRGRRR